MGSVTQLQDCWTQFRTFFLSVILIFFFFFQNWIEILMKCDIPSDVNWLNRPDFRARFQNGYQGGCST